MNKALRKTPTSKSFLLVWFFVGSVLLSAMGVLLVLQVYEFRKEFAYLQELKNEEVNYDVVWGQLLLEQSALTQPGRLEQTAVKELGMHAPSANEIVIVKP